MLEHLASLLLVSQLSISARAGELSTRDLVQRLTGEGHVESIAEYFAKGYLDGLMDATEGTFWCTPPNVRTDHELDIGLLHRLKAEPAYASSSADLAVIASLSQRFPCANSLSHPSTPRQKPSAVRAAMLAPSASARGRNLRAMSDGYISGVLDVAQLNGESIATASNRNDLKTWLLTQSPPSRKSAAEWILSLLRARPRPQGD